MGVANVRKVGFSLAFLKSLLVTSATLVVTGALLVVTRSFNV